MKKWFSLLLALTMALSLAACGAGNTSGPQESQPGSAVSETPAPAEPDAAPETPEEGDAPYTLVAYFSATGNTEGVAELLQTALDADLYEIVPEVAYTSEDLNYSSDDCRANQEQNDPDARPAIDGSVENMDSYDVIFLGYPIWWGEAPKIISTFLESYDFTGKTIVPFCTSGSSGIGSSAEHLAGLAGSSTWLEGACFAPGASQEEVAAWVDGLEL